MDVLWLILVVLAWLVLLKWVLPRFKLTGCGPGKCGCHPSEAAAAAPPAGPERPASSPASPNHPVHP